MFMTRLIVFFSAVACEVIMQVSSKQKAVCYVPERRVNSDQGGQLSTAFTFSRK
jgi:hypothetical protein